MQVLLPKHHFFIESFSIFHFTWYIYYTNVKVMNCITIDFFSSYNISLCDFSKFLLNSF